MKNICLKLNRANAAFCAIVFAGVLLSCQTHESLALICRLTVCQLSDSGVCLTVIRGWRGNGYTFPMASSSSLPPVSPSSFHPHMSAQVLTKLRIVGSLGTYGAERRRNEGWREERGGEGWVRERERSCQGNVYPCHSSQKSAMDKWITAISDCQGGSSVRFDAFLRAEWLSRNRMHKLPHLQSRNFFLPHFPSSLKCFILCGLRLCTQECSVYSVAEILLTVHKHAQAHTQTRVNSQCAHVDRVSELWLQADSV